MNNFFRIAVLLLTTFFVSFQADALAQQVGSGKEEEEAIDLDSLKDEDSKQSDEGPNAQEALLEPTNAEPVEKERHPWLMWSALAVLVPVASLLLPMRRNQ